MDSLFSNCYSIVTYPDISKWNTSKVEFMKFMFFNCYSLSEMANVNGLKTAKKSATNFMFRGCINATPTKNNPEFIN